MNSAPLVTPFGVYLHIPFCRRRCPYCDFAFVVRRDPPVDRFVDELLAEIALDPPPMADSVYFGGGTPSLLAPEQVARILRAVPRRPDATVTLEANPEDAAGLAGYRAAGVNRLSLGVQSLRDVHLRTLGRTHDAGQALGAVCAAVAAGFESVSADLIFGIPCLGREELLEDADRLVEAGVRHISAYGLTIYEGTLLARDRKQGRFSAAPEQDEREQFLALHARLAERGFEHYEISNYARPGHRSRHNELYWTGGAYRGYGPSAHSYDPQARRRFWNLRAYDRWRSPLAEGRLPREGEENLTEAEALLERMYVGLRRSDGLSIREFAHLEREPAASRLAGLERAGLVRRQGETIALTVEGMAVADSVVETLLPA